MPAKANTSLATGKFGAVVPKPSLVVRLVAMQGMKKEGGKLVPKPSPPPQPPKK
jgi:hypothetical protein